MRIGILGGTFNPIHNGHIHLAECSLKKLCLKKVIFVPAYIPPHKKIRGNATTDDRLRMLRKAVAGDSRFAVTLYEMRGKGKSYSVKTARFLRRSYGASSELFFLIGADSLAGLMKWKDIASLKRLVQFAVAPRPGFKKKAPKGILKITMRKKNISSTRIRHLVKRGHSIKDLVPASICKYIEEKKLYK